MEIRVYKNAVENIKGKYIYCVQTDLNDNISFPYESCIKVLKAIYGMDSVITFNIC